MLKIPTAVAACLLLSGTAILPAHAVTNAQFQKLQQQVADLSSKLTDLASRVLSVETQPSAQVIQLQAAVSSAEVTLQQLQSDVTALKNSSAPADIRALQDRATKLEQSLSSLATNASVDTVRGMVNSLSAQVVGQSGQLIDLAARLKKLEPQQPPPPPPAPPALTLSAAPLEIQLPAATANSPRPKTTTTWSATGATACTASGGWSGARPVSGSEDQFPVAPTTYNMSCTGPGGTDTKSVAVNVLPAPVPIPDPTPTPTPTPTPSADDTMTVASASGSTVANYPLQIGRPTLPGEIAHCAQVVYNGTALPTQDDVKNRWPDGSRKFGVLVAVIPQIPATGSLAVTFQDQPCANVPIPAADLLAQFPDFDATIKIAGSAVGSANSASARQMLADGVCKPWTSGPVAQTMVCADRSAARQYDLGSDQWRSLHPEFVVTFWPATKQVFVRYVGEISNTHALEAFVYDLELTAGKANPQSVYKQTGIQQSIATRWTRTTWIGGAPEPKVNIDYNLGYIEDANYLPNYDRSLKIPESVLSAAWTQWQSLVTPADKAINGAGLWMKGMANVSYHPDIGHMPLWHNRAVYSGDWRMREVMLRQADLAGAFPMQLRTGDPTKKADRAHAVPAIGLPMTVYGWPTSWVLDPRTTPAPADALVVRSPRNANGHIDLFAYNNFVPDGAHQPDPFFVPYMMTGDPFYLDGLQLWASLASLMDNPAYRNYAYAVIYDGQVRTDAWILRTRLHAALASPDDDPMRAIFNDMIDDALGYWEGARNIKGTKYENTAIWKFSNRAWGTSQDGWFGLGPHPLGWWARGFGPGSGAWDCTTDTATYDTSVCYSTNSPWQQDFLIIELGRAVELGFAADKLFASAAKVVIGQLTDPDYNARMIGRYQIPDSEQAPNSGPPYKYFTTWKDVMRAWSPAFRDRTIIDYWPATGAEYYWDVARGAAGMAANLPGGDLAWQRLGALIAAQTALTGQAPNWNPDPTWAFVPRKPVQ